MRKKFGGVDNTKTLEEVEEAIVYDKPPVHFSKFEILVALFVQGAKIFPLVLAVMLAVGGIFVLFGNLST